MTTAHNWQEIQERIDKAVKTVTDNLGKRIKKSEDEAQYRYGGFVSYHQAKELAEQAAEAAVVAAFAKLNIIVDDHDRLVLCLPGGERRMVDITTPSGEHGDRAVLSAKEK